MPLQRWNSQPPPKQLFECYCCWDIHVSGYYREFIKKGKRDEDNVSVQQVLVVIQNSRLLSYDCLRMTWRCTSTLSSLLNLKLFPLFCNRTSTHSSGFLSWGLKFSSEKCVHMRSSRSRFDNAAESLSVLDVQMKHRSSHKGLGVTVDSNLKFHQNVGLAVAIAGAAASNLLKSTVCCWAQYMTALLIIGMLYRRLA